VGARVDRPLIGVTTSEVRRSETVRQTPQGEPPDTEMALGLKYLRAIELAGGLPVVLPPLENPAVNPLLDHLAGICLSGGPDLDPDSYGARAHPELGPVEPEVDRFELEVARLAWKRKLPVLAICRGAQALNVSRGGTLFQHLPDVEEVRLDHRQSDPGDRPTHAVEIAPETLLAKLMGPGEAEVNSFHHQAVDRLGRGLDVVARSADGVVEGIEAPAREFVLGVQWHAEAIVQRPEQAALFEGLVDAAREGTAAARRAA
jgi:putative glutamine amidotransferase